MFLPLVAILSIGLDKMLLSGNDGKNKKSKQRWWFTVGGLRKKKSKNKKVNNKDDDSQWEVWGRLPPAQLCLNLGLPTLRSVRVSVLSFHFIHLLHIFSFFFEPPLSIFSKFSHFFRITLSVSQGVRQTKSFAIYGVFFIYSPQFSAPKLKMSCSQQWRKFSKYKRLPFSRLLFKLWMRNQRVSWFLDERIRG